MREKINHEIFRKLIGLLIFLIGLILGLNKLVTIILNEGFIYNAINL